MRFLREGGGLHVMGGRGGRNRERERTIAEKERGLGLM